jgi:uncharacterized protein DUF3857/transglutaminase superfamily protein
MFKKLLLPIMLLAFMATNACPTGDLIKAAGGKDKYPNADFIVVFDSTFVDVQETGLSDTNIHQLYKILSPKGALDKAVITFGYDPLSAFSEIEKVLIYRANGDVEEIANEKEMDYPAPARMIYWGAREKMLEVGRLEPGDAIEVFLFRKGFTYALLTDGNNNDDERYIPPMRGHFYDIVEFWNSQPVLEKVYQTAVPKDKLVQYEFYNGEVQSSAVLLDEKMLYTFTKKDMMPIEREPNMVGLSDVAPKLLISSSPDWKAKSLWFYGVNEDYGSFESTPEIDKKVNEILKGSVSEQDSIERLTHWVADEIRYSGISMGEGEGFTLHKGEMNFADRCGVCKDKAGMLITMLRAAGFESFPAMTMAGSRIDYIPADQFNHCVTLVKRNTGELELLDPTWVPFIRELWSSAEQQQNFLPGIPGGSDLKVTPLSAPENHYFKMKGESEILADGTLQGWLELEAEGQTDASIRRFFVRNYKSEWNKSMIVQFLGVSPKAQVSNIKYSDPYNYMAGPIKITFEYKIPDYALVSENEIVFDPMLVGGIFRQGMSHLYTNLSPKERKYPFRDRCSRLVELNESIKIPAGFKTVFKEKEIEIGDEVSSFKGSFVFKDGKIQIRETIRLGKRIYDAENWEFYKKTVENQKEFAAQKIILVNN